MAYNPNNHHRKSIRLHGYDYSAAGYYFVTICTHQWECYFGEVHNGEMCLNRFGRIVEREWLATAEIRRNLDLDEYVVMPNHFHGILIITYTVGATGPVAPTLAANSLGSIIGQFKSMVTKKIRKTGSTNFKWQRNFYERIIRNERELQHIRQYIINNPLKWELNRENPENLHDP